MSEGEAIGSEVPLRAARKHGMMIMGAVPAGLDRSRCLPTAYAVG
jgi:hypothetical protein